MKKAWRRLGYAVGVIVLLLVFGTLVPRPLWREAVSGDLPSRRILLLSNPIHTDIAIPVDAGVLARFAPLVRAGIRADLPGARYLVFGWGGRSFYINTPTWADLKPGPLLLGLTLDNSVMHVAVTGDIAEPQSFVAGFDLTDAQFGRLLDFIAGSFRQGPDGPIRIGGAAYGDHDGFFEANGYFSALVGCNTWTAQALRVAGLRTGWWTPLPRTLVLSLGLYN